MDLKIFASNEYIKVHLGSVKSDMLVYICRPYLQIDICITLIKLCHKIKVVCNLHIYKIHSDGLTGTKFGCLRKTQATICGKGFESQEKLLVRANLKKASNFKENKTKLFHDRLQFLPGHCPCLHLRVLSFYLETAMHCPVFVQKGGWDFC
jgi:hypothetical protein